MSLFVLDTAGDSDLLDLEWHGVTKVEKVARGLLEEKQSTAAAKELTETGYDSETEYDFGGLPPPSFDISSIVRETLELTMKPKSKADRELERISKEFEAKFIIGSVKPQRKQKQKRGAMSDLTDFDETTGKFDVEALVQTDVAKEMSKSRLIPGWEQLKELPRPSKKQQRKQNREEREKTKGPGWFNLPATERTEETINELKILQMRSVLNPKHFYKKNDLKVLPKYFQIGTVQHSPLDYYSERGTRKNKRKSMVEELLQDEQAQSYTKRKYKEVIAKREKYGHRKALQKMRKLKKNKA